MIIFWKIVFVMYSLDTRRLCEKKRVKIWHSHQYFVKIIHYHDPVCLSCFSHTMINYELLVHHMSVR